MMKEVRKLNTILFADIAGYTAIMQRDEAKAIRTLKRFESILEEVVPEYDGKIIQYFGDGCLLSFDSATAGVKCSLALHKEFIAKDLPVRIGLHLGEVVFAGNNAFGDGVNIASRIESMGVPGSILLSSVVRNQIRNKHEFDLESLGSFEFKNVVEPIEVFALKNEDLIVPVRDSLQGKFKTVEKKSARPLWIGITALVLTTLLIGLFYFQRDEPVRGLGSGSEVNSIAVLPLINLNKNEELEYFSDGVTQEIIDELAKIGLIRVSAFSTTFQYKNSSLTHLEIAKELGTQYLVAGSARFFESSNRIKLSIELIDPYTNTMIWSTTFDEAMNNAPSIQLAVAREVANILDIELTIAEEKDLESPNTESGEAFRLYLHAKSEINKLSPAGFEIGAKYLEEALKLDPNYSQAHTMLAWRYTVGASADLIPGIKNSSKASVALARPYIQQAIDLDPEASDIYLVRANLKLYSQNQIELAKEDVERAFEKNSWPRIPTNYCICTAVSAYIAANDLPRAKEIAALAKEIDPGHVLYDWDHGNIALKEGDYLLAKKHYTISVEKADIPFFNSFLGLNYYYLNEYEAALEHLNKAYENAPVPSRLTVAALANTYYGKGDQVRGDEFLQELLDRQASGEPHLNLYIAYIYLTKEERSTALDYMERGVQQSDFGFAVFLSLIPSFQKLSGEPRFEAILEAIQSPGLVTNVELSNG